NDKQFIQTVQKGKKEEWWNIGYLMWFYDWGGNAIVETYDKQSQSNEMDPLPFLGPGTRELISQNGLGCFIKDMDGTGRTFLPGVFCMAWYEKEFGLGNYDDLKNQFETGT